MPDRQRLGLAMRRGVDGYPHGQRPSPRLPFGQEARRVVTLPSRHPRKVQPRQVDTDQGFLVIRWLRHTRRDVVPDRADARCVHLHEAAPELSRVFHQSSVIVVLVDNCGVTPLPVVMFGVTVPLNRIGEVPPPLLPTEK